MVCTSVAPLSGGQAIAVAGGVTDGHLAPYVTGATAVALIEVSTCTIFLLLLLLEGGSVEVVEHQVHVRALLHL